MIMKVKKRKALGLLVLYQLLRKQAKRKRQRRIWCRQWIANHDNQGSYCNLIRELEESDKASFTNFLRLPKELFDDLLQKIAPNIQ